MGSFGDERTHRDHQSDKCHFLCGIFTPPELCQALLNSLSKATLNSREVAAWRQIDLYSSFLCGLPMAQLQADLRMPRDMPVSA
jgi:hypothetical protein